MKYLSKDEHGYITIHCMKCGHPHKAVKPCGFRFCPVCSLKRQIRVRSHLSQLFEAYKKYPDYRLRMITLSCRNVKDLAKGVDHLIKSFRRLRNAKKWGLYVSGGIAVVEIKGRPNDWHPHLHVIVYSKYMPWQWLQKQWNKCSGGQAVWVSLISKDKALYYVTKYVTKIDLIEHIHDDPNEAMKGRRLFIKFGEFALIPIVTRKWLWVCTLCGFNDFLTEFELRKYGKAFDRHS